MQLHSRGKARGPAPRAPLSDAQKDAIRTHCLAGMSAPQIADELGIGEGQVQYWRAALGISVSTTAGRNAGRRPSSPLKPRHVKGEVGEPEWFASCDAAFQTAMRGELELREKESVAFQ